jgi:hypothetical protein
MVGGAPSRIVLWTLLVVLSGSLNAQVPSSGLRLWLRADSLVQSQAGGYVSRWGNIARPEQAAVPGGASIVTLDTLNGRPALVFRGDAYLEAPAIMPVRSDYTLIVVMRIDDVAATNNIVSGNNRAFWLGSNVYPRVLHAGNFGQQAVSSVPVRGPAVLRVRYAYGSGVARIDVNNQPGAADVVPANTDSVIFLGAYLRGNFLKGRIAEVLLYDRPLEGAELVAMDAYLHGRYAIDRFADPPPPRMSFTAVPGDLLVARCGDSIVVEGRVLRSGITELRATITASGELVARRVVRSPSVDTDVRLTAAVVSLPVTMDVLIVADTLDTTVAGGRIVQDTILARRSIVCGDVISINGQSNSIWGAQGIVPSPWARTFGGNYSQQRADTLFRQSIATGTGGGANVGGWGLWLQNAIADSMNTATLVINGGVGGTRIEQHLPDAKDRSNLSTIYGSWLYRILKSGTRERIRWLFWYQGESNGGTDDYLSLFDRLRSAWLEDLPNLQHIVVVQIRPGCGPAGHARIRDMQRQLEGRYPDVLVHAAAGLPGHDGCHYTTAGYVALGEQLFDLYRINELGMMPAPFMTSPTIDEALCADGSCTRVRLAFRRGSGLRFTPDTTVGGALRRATDAFFGNGDTAVRPRSVDVDPETGTVTLDFEERVTTVSYIPDTYYAGTNVVYQGPWLVTAQGVGALTFHNIAVSTTTVDDSRRAGSTEFVEPEPRNVVVIDVRGRIITTDPTAVNLLPSGVYIVRDGHHVRRICVTN